MPYRYADYQRRGCRVPRERFGLLVTQVSLAKCNGLAKQAGPSATAKQAGPNATALPSKLGRGQRPSKLGQVQRPSKLGQVQRPSKLGQVQRLDGVDGPSDTAFSDGQVMSFFFQRDLAEGTERTSRCPPPVRVVVLFDQLSGVYLRLALAHDAPWCGTSGPALPPSLPPSLPAHVLPPRS